MAKQQELTYLQVPLHPNERSYNTLKLNWSGLNKRQKLDTGLISMESNISTNEAPYLTPSQRRIAYKSGYATNGKPISLFGFDDFLLVVYRRSGQILIDYINAAGSVFTGVLKASGATEADDYPRSIVKFNVYDTPTDPLGGNFVKKLLIFPDSKSMDFLQTGNFTPSDLNYGVNRIPPIKYACVHLSRVFGVDDGRIYVSGFNDYANWNLDTIEETNPSNAWASPAQANTQADGKLVGIYLFANHVICFKEDFMHEIFNNRNPFRIQDVFAEGTIDNRSIQDVDGQLIFVDDDNVKVYTGGNPRMLSYYLGENRYIKAVAGTDGRRYFLYCLTDGGHRFYVYDTLVEQWSEEAVSQEIVGFARSRTGMYHLAADGVVYKMDTGDFWHEWHLETDFYTNNTVNIKRIRKVQMLTDIEAGSNLTLYLLYDDEVFNPSTSHKIFEFSNNTGRMVKRPIRVVPRQTANFGFRLHIVGYGFSRLYQLELSIKQGGELFV